MPVDAAGRVPVHADHFQERLLVGRIAVERTGRLGDSRAGQIRLPAHDGGDRGRGIAPLVAVVWHAHRHQQRAQVSVSQAQRPEIVRILGDLLGRVAGVIDNDLLRHNHGVHRVAERFHVELPVRPHELHQVQRGQVARRIVHEHVLRTGVRSVDPRRVLARIPAVHRGIELHAGVAALVRRFGDLPHHVARLAPLHGLAGRNRARPPVAVRHGGFHEIVGGAHRVVGILEKDGAVSFAVKRRIVARFHQRVGLLLFLGLAPDEVLHVGVVGV